MTDLPTRIRAGMAQLAAASTATMLDACQVTRPGDLGQTPTLDADGNPVATPTDPVVYDGPCLVADPKLATLRNRTVDDQDGVPDQRELRTPHAADLRTGDVVTITASAFSPGLVGDTFVIVREDEHSYAAHRAYILRGSSWQPPA